MRVRMLDRLTKSSGLNQFGGNWEMASAIITPKRRRPARNQCFRVIFFTAVNCERELVGAVGKDNIMVTLCLPG
jgi:hypothetical protein